MALITAGGFPAMEEMAPFSTARTVMVLRLLIWSASLASVMYLLNDDRSGYFSNNSVMLKPSIAEESASRIAMQRREQLLKLIFGAFFKLLFSAKLWLCFPSFFSIMPFCPKPSLKNTVQLTTFYVSCNSNLCFRFLFTTQFPQRLNVNLSLQWLSTFFYI